MKFLKKYYLRWTRLCKHLMYPIYKIDGHLPPYNILVYIGDLVYYLIDVFFIPDLFLGINKMIKPGIRKLNQEEMLLIKNFYGNTINTDNILIDDDAKMLTKKHVHAYVTMNLINFRNTITTATLMHELVHVWQYQKYGVVYIFRALLAQISKDPYNYGGVEGLKLAMANDVKFVAFNFEQQASIIEHYYEIIQYPSWKKNEELKVIYKHFFDQMTNIKSR